MKRIIYISLVLIFCQIHLYAQKETSWWYFGFNAGLNFNSLSNVTANDGTIVSDMPQSIVGALSTREGCFTVSTYNGQLLFSSDGMIVYDKNGNIMTNGTDLLGGSSATQSGIVVPRPETINEYFIITVPEGSVPNGICYSTVDITANGGLGAVTSKNQIIKSGVVNENITIVPNLSNYKDYWLIHRTKTTFYVWAITYAGISITPHQTLSNSSIVALDVPGYVEGEIGISSDYTKVFSCNWYGSQVITANFNPITGYISDIKTQSFPYKTYAGCFSPDGNYLYIGSGYDGNKLYVQTWDKVRAGTAMNKIADNIGNVKAAIDNRLYGIQTGGDLSTYVKHLFVIRNPNAGGTDIKYFPNYLKNTVGLGLPSFAAGFIRIKPKSQPFACATHSRTYGVEVDLSGGNAPVKLEWDFGDGSPIVTQSVSFGQTEYSLQHSYSNSGIYTILVTPYKADGTKSKVINMEANIVYCTLKTNLMTRSELLNSKQQQK